MATRKPSSGTSKTGKTTGAAARTSAKASEPVVLDPPKAASAKPAKEAETIEAKAVDVTPEAPKQEAAKPEPAKAGSAPKAEEKPAEKPAEKSAEVAEPPPPPPNSQGRGTSGLVALVAGGAIAAGIGWFANDALNPPVALPDYSAEFARTATVQASLIADQNARIDAQAAEITKLADRVAALEAARAASPVAQAEEEILALKTELEGKAAELADRLATTEARLTELLADLEASRSRISDTLGTAGAEVSGEIKALLEKYDVDIAALKAQLAEQAKLSDDMARRLDDVAAKANEKLDEARAKVSELTTQATESARNIDLSLTRERLKVAVESGRAYAAILAELADQAAGDIPEALLKSADEGVSTLAELQAAYPAAAREALKASIRAEAGEGTGNKVWAFLKSQVGARSLEEREGDDPDAVLSQAEAALGRGELQAAVDLVKTLPAAGLVEMAGWLARAEARLAVERALADFAQKTE